MAISRKKILYDGSFAHCTWRCLNREFLLQDSKIKDYILATWAKYKERYQVKIYDYAIMDNHVHMLIHANSVDNLGNFMRTCNSLIARFINKTLKRDSHALRERYQSPLIEEDSYLINTIGYIWLNFYRATGLRAEDYKYCSLYYRFRGMVNKVLDDYADLPLVIGAKMQKFIVDILTRFMSMKKKLVSSVFEHNHTIGSYRLTKSRGQFFANMRKRE